MKTIKLLHNVNPVIFPHGPLTESFNAVHLGANLARVENVLMFAPPCTMGDHVEFDPETHEVIKVVDRVRQPRAAVAEGHLRDDEVIAVKRYFKLRNCPSESFRYAGSWLFSVAIPATMEDDTFLAIVGEAPAELSPIKWDLLDDDDDEF